MDPKDYVLTNATVVTAARVVEGGWVAVCDGRIVEIGEGRAPERGFDLGGDLLIPGLIELHTDHLEPHFNPRPSVYWNPMAAVLAYDSQIAASGITTVFDSLRVGDDSEDGIQRRSVTSELTALAEALRTAEDDGLTRAEHRTHLRCEICAPDVIEGAAAFLDRFPVDLLSLMDHTPGQRQFRDVEKLLVYWRGKIRRSDDELHALARRRIEIHHERAEPHRRALVELAQARGIVMASHDDATLGQVEEAIADGVAIAEFPTTMEAAAASHAAGIHVLMGAPNVVRRGSHSGNVAATALAEAGILDVLSSDYVPAALIMAAFDLPGVVPGIDLPQAIRLVTKNPAEAAGLTDRGEITAGKRADLVRVTVSRGHPVVRTVWREGRRVV